MAERDGRAVGPNVDHHGGRLAQPDGVLDSVRVRGSRASARRVQSAVGAIRREAQREGAGGLRLYVDTNVRAQKVSTARSA